MIEFLQQRLVDKQYTNEYSNRLYARIKERFQSVKALNEQESQVINIGQLIKHFYFK